MKIICVTTSRLPSNTANSIQVMKAVHAMAQKGHQVRLLAPAQEGAHPTWEPLAARYGLSQPFPVDWLRSIPQLKRSDFAWAALRRARNEKADLLYTWTIQAAVLGLLLGLPVIYELHDLPKGQFGPLWFRLFLKLGRRKRLLPITQALLESVERHYGKIPAAQVVIAPNGVDLAQYENLPGPMGARAALNLPEAPTALCSGHLYAGRGVELFLGLAERFPTASFVWVGGRPKDVEAVRARAEGAGRDNVLFTGFVDQGRLPLYQAAADVLLMPYDRTIAGSGGGNSADICSPMKMFDYLAAGRAILTSDLPVFREVLNSANACFAPPEDQNGWAAQLGRLLSERDFRERLAAQARADATQYSWQTRAERALEGMPGK